MRRYFLLAVQAAVVFGSGQLCSAVVVPSAFTSITPIRAAGSSSAEYGYAATGLNATSYNINSLTTATAPSGDRYQFVSYYDALGKLVVGRRKMLSGGWSDWTLDKTVFTAYNISDAHDVSSIAVDGDGYLHLSWGMHSNNLLYTRSTASVLNDGTFSLVGDSVGNSGGLGSSAFPSPLNTTVTYPEFYNIPGSGDLLLAYRNELSTSTNGIWQLFRWNNATNTWSGVHASAAQPWISNSTTNIRLSWPCAYINSLAFDSTGKLNLTWSWRTNQSPYSYTDYQANHNIMYASSPDQGVNWYRQDGTLYQQSGQHAIDESNAPPVVSVFEGSSLGNTSGMAVGPDNGVYLASWWAPKSPQGDQLRQYMLNWYDGAAWHTSQIGNRNPENVGLTGVSQRVPESQLLTYRMGRPVVAVDDENRVIVAFSDWQRGGVVSIAISQNASRDDWQIFDLTDENMYSWEPTYDLSRWASDDVLSIFYQPMYGSSSAVSVLEWDARAYFAAVPEPSTAVLLGILAVCAFVACRKSQRWQTTLIDT